MHLVLFIKSILILIHVDLCTCFGGACNKIVIQLLAYVNSYSASHDNWCITLKQDNDSTVRGDGGSRVGEVRAGTTSPMPKHKGFMLQ